MIRMSKVNLPITCLVSLRVIY